MMYTDEGSRRERRGSREAGAAEKGGGMACVVDEGFAEAFRRCLDFGAILESLGRFGVVVGSQACVQIV